MIKKLQNKTLKPLFLTLLLGILGSLNLFSQTVPTGAINGLFSVSASQQVYFSKGNLQYIGSASSPYWKFADRQWDYLGDNGQGSTNPNVDRDLFGWGTSRWDNGNTYYRPWDTDFSDGCLYGPPGSYNLTDSYANADWGVYNPISNGGNQANLWRTLTKNERNYVFNTRTTNSGIRYAKANVNGVNGVILLPDNWNTSYYTLNNSNSTKASFNSNTISYSTWTNSLEAHGAVFLPAAGVRNHNDVLDVGSYGSYWTASYYDQGDAYSVIFMDWDLYTDTYSLRKSGRSVRLVCPAVNSAQSNTINVSASPSAGGSVSGSGTYNNGSSCTLTATPATEYKFTRWTQNGIQVSTNASYTFTVFASGSYEAEFTKDVITFADANVKALCVANWDTNGDNELSYVEAAAVTDLGSVFKGNTNITSFNELAYFTGVTTIANNAFQNCTNLTSVRIPNSVTSIGNSAFSGCTRLTSVTIPNSVTSIENYAFYGCAGLTSVTIPNSVTSIGGNVFNGCSSIVAIAVEAGNSYYDSRDNCNAIIETNTNTLITGCNNTIIPNTVTSIGYAAFFGRTGLISVTIPNSVTSIGDYAFNGCTGLTSITIPNSVTSLGDYSFVSCRGLTSMTIPNSVTSIGPSTFASCTGLTSVTIPNSVTSLGNSAFYRCTGLTSVTIPNSVTSIGQSVFKDCSSLSEVYYNATNCTNLTSGLNAPFQSCGGKLIIGDNVERIPNNMFYRAGFTGSLVIPNSVTSIGSGAFQQCTSLTSVVIPSSVTSFGYSAFYSCTSLTSLFILNEVPPTLGYEAFQNVNTSIPVNVPCDAVETYTNAAWGGFNNFSCSNINFTDTNVKTLCVDNWDTNSDGELSLGEAAAVTDLGTVFQNKTITSFDELQYFTGLTTIKAQAFRDCLKLTSITIPNSVLSIEEFAFASCQKLASIEIPSSVTSIGRGVLYNSYLLEQIVVSSDNPVYDSRNNCNAIIKTSTNELIEGCKNTIIPNTVTSIGDYALGCQGLTSIEIPHSVTSIGEGAFNCCLLLTSVVIPNSVTTMKSSFNSGGLRTVIMEGDCPNISIGSPFHNINGFIYVPYEYISNYKSNPLMGYDPNVTNKIKGWLQTTIDGYGDSQNSDHWCFIASPLTAATDPTTIDDMIATTATEYDLYRFNQAGSDGEWENYKVHGFDLTNGQGYLYANKSNMNLMFKGDFNENTTQNVPLTYVSGTRYAGYNLVGNPFPVNAYSSRPYYVMNSNGDAVIANAISTNEPIAPCMGVIVQAMENENNPTVTFSTSLPSTSNKGNINIALSQQVNRGNATIDRAIVSFNDGDQLGKFVLNEKNTQIYLPKNGKDYAIANAETTGETPLNFKATRNGEYTLTVNPENVEMEYLHLIDNLTGNDVDLLATPSYNFQARTDDYASRFRLVFSANSINENNAEPDNDFAFISNGQLVVNSEGTLQVFDALGRQLYVKELSTANYQLPIVTSPGVYVLRLINGENVKTQKIVVK
ncbi:MAG: leucine-rich repeat domain-containing protein [Bacteroidales bacterium]|nr:leucine-rich repeat domain-containing protein [Bacteroidales bacterium]